MTSVRTIRLAVFVTIAIAVIAAVFAWRWRTAGRTPPPLEPGWEALVVTIAGDGATARLGDPFGVATAPDGTLFVADGGDEPRILRISPDGAMRTMAGGRRGFADGAGTQARFDSPSGLAIDRDGLLYVADTANHAIRRIAPDGHVTTLAGNGIAGDADGPGTQARLNGPIGIAVDGQGRVIVADTYNDRIRAISRDGVVTTIAGGAGSGSDDGAADQARFDTPCGVAVDADGNIYVADSGNGTIRRIDRGGTVSTIASDAEGIPLRPVGIALDPDGTSYITDERGRIVELTKDFRGRTIAGTVPGFKDGVGREARFRRLTGLAVAGGGRFLAASVTRKRATGQSAWLPPDPGCRSCCRHHPCSTRGSIVMHSRARRSCGQSHRWTALTKSRGRWAKHGASRVRNGFTPASMCASRTARWYGRCATGP